MQYGLIVTTRLYGRGSQPVGQQCSDIWLTRNHVALALTLTLTYRKEQQKAQLSLVCGSTKASKRERYWYRDIL